MSVDEQDKALMEQRLLQRSQYNKVAAAFKNQPGNYISEIKKRQQARIDAVK